MKTPRSVVSVVLAHIAVLGLSHSAHAETTLNAKTAQALIDACAAHARAKQQSHAIAVVDPGGVPIALLRMDGNSPGITTFALRKAEAVAAWRFPTADMAKSAQQVEGFARAPAVVTVAGGVPIWDPDNGTFLGGIGVSGEAPEDDDACARAAITAVKLAAERPR